MLTLVPKHRIGNYMKGTLNYISGYFYLVLVAIVLSACGGSKEVSTAIYTVHDYKTKRNELVKKNYERRFEGTYTNDSMEIIAGDYFELLKRRQRERIADIFPNSKHFIDQRRFINSSPFFENYIRTLPKGGLLHGHSLNLGDYFWLADTATLYQNCYMYTGQDEESTPHGTLKFMKKAPDTKWREVSSLKEILGEDFEEEIHNSITIGKDDYPYENMRKKYHDCFKRIDGLLRYRPLFKDYIMNMVEGLVKDGVQYLEFHSSFNGMYDLERSYQNPEQEMDLYVTIQNKIKRKHPGFDFRIIYNVSESQAKMTLYEHYKLALKMYESYPTVLAGFDFATADYSEDEMDAFVKTYLEIKADPYYADIKIPFHFNPKEGDKELHANIYDAVVMKSKRVGYSYELYKYPALLEEIKAYNGVIEVSPISNQVLGYNTNLADHPAILYINHGYPIIIGANNKGVMKFDFSHQFYVAAIEWDLDLRGIKKLIMTSLEYANLPDWKKKDLIDIWKKDWDAYVKKLVDQSSEMF